MLKLLDPGSFRVSVIERNETEDGIIYTSVNESLLLDCENSPSNPPVFSKIFEIYRENKLIENKAVNSVRIKLLCKMLHPVILKLVLQLQHNLLLIHKFS